MASFWLSKAWFHGTACAQERCCPHVITTSFPSHLLYLTASYLPSSCSLPHPRCVEQGCTVCIACEGTPSVYGVRYTLHERKRTRLLQGCTGCTRQYIIWRVQCLCVHVTTSANIHDEKAVCVWSTIHITRAEANQNTSRLHRLHTTICDTVCALSLCK